MSLCHSLKTEYDALKKLTQEFVSACSSARLTTGDFQHLSPQELQTLQLLKQRVETARETLKNKLLVSPKAAEAIMNKDMGTDETKRRFFGLESIKTAFNIDIPIKDLLPIPFSTQELKEAKERGDYLILRISHIPDNTPDGIGTPLTMEKIADLVQPTLDKNSQGKALYDTDWYQNEPFYTTETPHNGWALVSKEPLPTTTIKDYVEQTTAIIDHITTTLLNNREIHLHPKERTVYQDAIDQWNRYIQKTFPNKTNEQVNNELRSAQWKEYAEQLSILSITALTRHTTVEALYDAMLFRATTNSDKLLPNIYTWTSSSSVGGLVGLGSVDDSGADVREWHPDDRYSDLGVLFVRRGPR